MKRLTLHARMQALSFYRLGFLRPAIVGVRVGGAVVFGGECEFAGAGGVPFGEGGLAVCVAEDDAEGGGGVVLVDSEGGLAFVRCVVVVDSFPVSLGIAVHGAGGYVAQFGARDDEPCLPLEHGVNGFRGEAFCNGERRAA